jgi:hypothetical protein
MIITSILSQARNVVRFEIQCEGVECQATQFWHFDPENLVLKIIVDPDNTVRLSVTGESDCRSKYALNYILDGSPGLGKLFTISGCAAEEQSSKWLAFSRPLRIIGTLAVFPNDVFVEHQPTANGEAPEPTASDMLMRLVPEYHDILADLKLRNTVLNLPGMAQIETYESQLKKLEASTSVAESREMKLLSALNQDARATIDVLKPWVKLQAMLRENGKADKLDRMIDYFDARGWSLLDDEAC